MHLGCFLPIGILAALECSDQLDTPHFRQASQSRLSSRSRTDIPRVPVGEAKDYLQEARALKLRLTFNRDNAKQVDPSCGADSPSVHLTSYLLSQMSDLSHCQSCDPATFVSVSKIA